MRVPLHETHVALGARFVEFAGFEMPVMYSSIVEEHLAVRQRAGLFDVSHMSNLWIRGAHASELVSRTVGANPARVKTGRASYTVALREDGSIIDDLIVYKFGEEEFHIVVNAGMNRLMTSWFQAHAAPDTTVEDVSREYCILAVQGPQARDVAARALEPGLSDAKRFAFSEFRVGRRKAFVAGTGYTGEDGLEIVAPNEKGKRLFTAILEAGRDSGIRPCGLGARDTLRLEKGYCLAPHEFAGGRTPLEAGLEWTLQFDHAFVGRQALEAQKDRGGYERMVGLVATDRGIPRRGYAIVHDNRRVGTITSGTMSPSLRKGIALGYVPDALASPGTALGVDIRGQTAPCAVTRLPFV